MENRTVIDARKNMYLFLSDLYLFEVDQEKLQGLKALEFPMDIENEDLKEGYGKITSYLSRKEVSQDTLDELAVDYARLFLSAGVASGKAAFPYESVYTSKQHMMMQEAGSNASANYGGKGLRPRKDMYQVPEDHLGLLLEFMARLCEEEKKEQSAFCKEHLDAWIPAFVQDVMKYATTDFYQGLALVTRGFVAMEKEYLCNK